MKIRLRHERLAVRLARGKRSQNAWALRLGLHKGHLSRLVNGKRPYPGPETRQRLLDGLDLSFEELFQIEVESPQNRLQWILHWARQSWRSRVQPPYSVIRGDGTLRMLLQDLRYSVRVFAKSPALTLVALLTLALGIGSNTAIFSLLYATLIEPIPYPEAERIVFLGTQHPASGNRGAVSFPDFLSWESASDWFSQMAVVGHENVTMRGNEGAVRVVAETVTAGYFDVLGIAPDQGRVFLRNEASEIGGSNQVVIVSHAFWRNTLGGKERILDTDLEISGTKYRVIGVMPRGFTGIFESAQIWLPLTTFDALNPQLVEYQILQSRGTRFLSGIARLSNGVTVDVARERMSELALDLGREFQRSNRGRSIVVDEVREELLGGFRRPILLLLGAVASVLLIASTNLANLFLARAAVRGRELAIRTAVGASAGRLVRQVLTESVTLSLAGGLLGVLLAASGLNLMLGLLPHTLPSFVEVGISLPVLLFSLALSILTGLAFGTLPALRSVRSDLVSTLKQDDRQASLGSSRRWFSGGLVAVEVALSLTLLVATGLMLKSFHNMQTFDPGFQVDGLLSMRFNIPAQKYDARSQDRLLAQILERVEGLPGVQTAALSSHVFFASGYMTGDFYLENREPAGPDERLIGYRHYVSPDFFRAVGVPLLQGRTFTGMDREDAAQVVIVNRDFAETLWPGEDPLGKRISLQNPATSDEVAWRIVAGVVGDVLPRMRASGALWQLYMPIQQGGEWSRYLMIRAVVPAATLAPSVRAVMREIDPEIPVFDWSEVSDFLEQSAAPTGFLATLLGLFGLLGLFLSAVGIYGVMSHTVTRARREIGIRMALGATRRDILQYFLRYGSVRTAIGLGVGGLISVWVVTLMTSQLYGVSPLDATVFTLVTAFLAGVAMLSCLIPSWSAARQDPLTTIRAE